MELSKPREWLYRASPAKEDLEGTRAIVRDFGFICRNAFADATKTQMIPHVQKVDFRHVIHLYFVDAGGGGAIGSFRVVGVRNHPRPELFGAAVEKVPPLRTVVDSGLLELLRPRYSPDPKLGVYAGWPVVPADEVTPAYDPGLFPGQSSLFEYLPRPRRR